MFVQRMFYFFNRNLHGLDGEKKLVKIYFCIFFCHRRNFKFPLSRYLFCRMDCISQKFRSKKIFAFLFSVSRMFCSIVAMEKW